MSSKGTHTCLLRRRATIYLGPSLPSASCGLPETVGSLIQRRAVSVSAWPCSERGLPSHPGHPGCWWSLTPPFHPYHLAVAVCFLLHSPSARAAWALPSALALRSPDFPRRLRRGRPAGSRCQDTPVAGLSVGDSFACRRAAANPPTPPITPAPAMNPATVGAEAGLPSPKARMVMPAAASTAVKEP